MKVIPCTGVGATAARLEDWKIGAASEETLIIDPSLGVLPRRDALPAVDRVVNSHCHEDHTAGNFLFREASVHLHEADLPFFSATSTCPASARTTATPGRTSTTSECWSGPRFWSALTDSRP